jgi:hypothetical protein
MKWLFAVLLLFSLAPPAILQADTPAFLAIANGTEIRVKQGNVSDPLTLQVRAVGSLAPVSGVRVSYDADPSLILLSHEQITNDYGYASVRCIALGQHGGRIQATVSNGAVIMFNVVVDPQAGTQISPDQQAYFEWQGTSTTLTGTPIHAVISSSDTGTQNANPAFRCKSGLFPGMQACSMEAANLRQRFLHRAIPRAASASTCSFRQRAIRTTYRP